MGASTVGFVVCRRPDLNGVVEVVPTIDEVELTALAHDFEKAAGMESRDTSYGGLIPAHYRFGPMSRHYLGGENGRIPLLGCEWGCWPLLAVVTATRDEVIWSDFEQPHRRERSYAGFGPFRFSRYQFDDATERLEVDLADPEQGLPS